MDQYIVIDTKTDQPVYRPDGSPVVISLPPGEYHLEWKEVKVVSAGEHLRGGV